MSKNIVDARIIGVIGKPHGIKGEIVMRVLTDYPGSISEGSVFFLDEKGSETVRIEKIRPKQVKGIIQLLVKFEGFDDRDEALALKGRNLFRDSVHSPELKEGQYWIDDLMYCGVYDNKGVCIGKVIDVEKRSSNENLLVRVEGDKVPKKNLSGGILYIPVIDDFIKAINIEEKKIILNKIPEYL